MALLQAGIGLSTITLWLGHEHLSTVQIYLYADLALREKALAKTGGPASTAGRYRAPDSLITFLDSL